MALEQYPLQRFFGVEPGERQQDQLAAFEARLAALESAYGLQYMQSAENEEPEQALLPHSGSAGFPVSLGDESFPVHITGEDQLLLVRWELDASTFGGSTDNRLSPWLYDGTSHYRLSTLQLTGSTVEYASRGGNPRGGQDLLCNFPQGDYTFTLWWSYQDLTTPGSVAVLSRRYLSVEVV